MQTTRCPGKFARDIVSFVDRARLKVNTLWLHEKNNASKTLIARSIMKLCITYHQVPPGSNRFMFQDCVNKRIIIMNEPFFDEVQIEVCKRVFEGTGCFLPVKMKNDQLLIPTPVLVKSNTDLWATNQAAKPQLENRIYKGLYGLKEAAFLKEVTKQLNPPWILYYLDNHREDHDMDIDKESCYNYDILLEDDIGFDSDCEDLVESNNDPTSSGKRKHTEM